MGRRKLKDKNIRKLTRTGNSITVSLPKEILNFFKWRGKQKVVVRRRGRKIVIEDWPVIRR